MSSPEPGSLIPATLLTGFLGSGKTANAVVLASFGEELGASTVLIDRALDLNPSFALGWLRCGVVRLSEGRATLAIEHFKKSLRLSPLGRMATRCRGWLGIAQFFNRGFDHALANLLAAQEELPDWLAPRRVLVACYVQLGRLKDAREATMRLEAAGAIMVPPLAASWPSSKMS